MKPIGSKDSFSLLVQAFESFKRTCRPLLAMDETHLRRKFPGTMLVAVTHDADHKLFPIAFAIAEIERVVSFG